MEGAGSIPPPWGLKDRATLWGAVEIAAAIAETRMILAHSAPDGSELPIVLLRISVDLKCLLEPPN